MVGQRQDRVRDSPVSGAGAGTTIWLTGLSGAGKSTIAEALAAALAEAGERVQILDGDEVRTNLSAGLGFSREDRTTHVTRVGFVAELLARHGVTVIVPVIAPYADARDRVRAHHDAHGTPYREVYVATSLEECRRRDVKGLYARSAAGELTGLTGVDDPYEPPAAPDLTIDTAQVAVPAAVARIRGLLPELEDIA
nr:adenylyl-sulfate kinase [Flexivirga meconopsidis]